MSRSPTINSQGYIIEIDNAVDLCDLVILLVIYKYTTTMRIAVVGGSLTGLGVANVLNRLGITVSVFEKFPSSFEQRGSSLGFVDVPLWELVRGATMIRFGRRASRDQGAFFYGDLWKYLYDGLPDGCVKFDFPVADLGDDNMRPTIDGEVYDAVIVADGGWSSLRRYVNGSEKQPEYAGYVIYRSKLDAKDFPDFGGEGIYNVGKYFSIALNVPTCDGRKFIMGGVAVGTPESEVVRPNKGASRHTEINPTETAQLPDWFLPLVRRTFATRACSQVVKWLELCATKGKISPCPQYEFAADRVTAGRIILMGDAAHMASPRTAVGAHTGLLDVAGLLEAFRANPGVDNIDRAIAAYAPGGVQRARDLYERSREVSRSLVYNPTDDDRRGPL